MWPNRSPEHRKGELGAIMSRFNVDFSDEAAAVLEELARRQNTTKAEVLRRAINLEKWFADTTAGGGKVLVEKDGQTREIVKL